MEALNSFHNELKRQRVDLIVQAACAPRVNNDSEEQLDEASMEIIKTQHSWRFLLYGDCCVYQ